MFVDVGQIVAGYTLEGAMTAGGSFPENGVLGGNTADVGGSVRYTDRPTITYVPMTGDQFVEALMTPLPPDSVFFTIESGWPADAILFTTLARMNGLRNQHADLSGFSEAEPGFLEAIRLMRAIQGAGAVGMRIVRDGDDTESTLATIRSENMSEQTLAEIRSLRRLLGLAPDASEFKLVFGHVASNDRELAMQTRSLLHILGVLAAQVEVPPEHVQEGRATPGIREAEADGRTVNRMARILSSKSKPDDAYVAVNYQDHWFWIDARDLKSKRTFAFMMLLFTLSDTRGHSTPPMITIPAQ